MTLFHVISLQEIELYTIKFYNSDQQVICKFEKTSSTNDLAADL